jgi:hypothetical protein
MPATRGVLFFLAVSALVCTARGPFAQSRPNVRIVTDVELVQIPVTVFDDKGAVATNLDKNDFLLLEDGIEQQIMYCEKERETASFVILADLSSSMTKKIPFVQEATLSILDPAQPQGQQSDEFSVFGVATRVTRIVPFTRDQQDLQRRLPLLLTPTNGSTALLRILTSFRTAQFLPLRRKGESMRNSELETISARPGSSETKALVARHLIRLAELIRKDGAPYPLTVQLVGVWTDVFQRANVEPGQIEAAFQKAERVCKFWPSPADVLGHITTAESNAAEEEAGQKWQRVLDYIRRHYNPDIPPKNAPSITERTQRAISAAGGLALIADCDPESRQWARKRFIEAYVRWGELQQDEYLLPPGEVRDLLAECAASKSVERLLETSKVHKSAHVPNPSEILTSKPIPNPHSDKEAELPG